MKPFSILEIFPLLSKFDIFRSNRQNREANGIEFKSFFAENDSGSFREKPMKSG